MTSEEYKRKWGCIFTGHNEGCAKRFSFDFDECSCGLDILWELRNADLRTVSDPVPVRHP